jgi:NAD(P)-dependent dehydrogenase (short-subunit alcohol dehydrogenase family)
MSEYQGSVAIVTGASRGIGFAIARELLDTGSRVCITARHADGVDDAVRALEPHGEVIGIVGKADSEDHQAEVIDTTLERFGRLDYLVNNAATNPQVGALVEAPLTLVNKVLAVNLLAPLSWTQRAWTGWMSEHGGAVLNIASTGGLQTGPSIGAYNVSKAGLIHLTAQLALELGPTVRVNALAPGLVKTQFAQPLYEDNEAELGGSGFPRTLRAPQSSC